MSDRPDIDAYLKEATEEARKDALIAELVEATEPFTRFADEADKLGHEDGSTCLWRIKASDLRRLRAALSKAKRETGQ